ADCRTHVAEEDFAGFERSCVLDSEPLLRIHLAEKKPDKWVGILAWSLARVCACHPRFMRGANERFQPGSVHRLRILCQEHQDLSLSLLRQQVASSPMTELGARDAHHANGEAVHLPELGLTGPGVYDHDLKR